MPLSGKGMLITLMNVDPSEQADFNDWYDKEHLAERVGIEGFTEARRYLAVEADPKYLNLYTTRTFDILSSPQYKKALANQTERSLHHIERFRDSGRAIVRVTASKGQGRGAALFFAAIRPAGQDESALRELLTKYLEGLIAEPDIISAHLVESDPELSKPLTADTPAANASDWYVMIDGTHPDAVRKHGQALTADAAVLPAEVLVSQGVYRLMWDLSKAEL